MVKTPIPLGFITILPTPVKGFLGPKKPWMLQSFFTNTLWKFFVSTLRIYRNPTKTGQGILIPYGSCDATT